MSDTDDTDELLLIPPDFFLVDLDFESLENKQAPYYNIVHNLINQVSDIQDRLESIESISDRSSLDTSMSHRYSLAEELYQPRSVQNTPQKPKINQRQSSLPCSPKTKISPRRTPKTSPNKISSNTLVSGGGGKNTALLEVESFLNKVKTIKRLNAARMLEHEFEPKRHQEAEEVLKEIDKRADIVPDNSMASLTESSIPKHTAYRMGDMKETVPDYGLGVRNRYHDDYRGQDKNIHKDGRLNDSTSSQESDLSQETAFYKYKGDERLHSNAVNVLNMHKRLLEESLEEKVNFMHIGNGELGLVNLNDIWSKTVKGSKSSDQQATLQRLEEERMRRKHCEQLIQDLQNQNLELQQKITVAVKVDESKNNAIRRFQETLEKLVLKLDQLKKERSDWEKKFQSVQIEKSKEIEEAQKKITFYENEASKAINLAHNNQDKHHNIEKQLVELQDKLTLFQSKYDELTKAYSKELEKSQHMAEIISQKEIELKEVLLSHSVCKAVLAEAREEVKESKKAVEECQGEFNSLKADAAALENDLKREKQVNGQLREQKRNSDEEIKRLKNVEKSLREELNTVKKQLDSNKLELRNFYQGQVELLVQNKLREFQEQLDKAEESYKQELKKREFSIAKSAASHLQQISEKCALEINLLEEKHEEEKRLMQIQLIKFKQENENLQYRLEQMQGKRYQIAEQLQKMMEAQWNEALKIINLGKSPAVAEGANCLDQLNSLKTRSYNNLEEVLLSEPEDFKAKPKDVKIADQTPLSTKPQSKRLTSQVDAQNFVRLLLSKDGEEVKDKEKLEGDKSNWQSIDPERESKLKGPTKERSLGKPPWK